MSLSQSPDANQPIATVNSKLQDTKQYNCIQQAQTAKKKTKYAIGWRNLRKIKTRFGVVYDGGCCGTMLVHSPAYTYIFSTFDSLNADNMSHTYKRTQKTPKFDYPSTAQ